MDYNFLNPSLRWDEKSGAPRMMRVGFCCDEKE